MMGTRNNSLGLAAIFLGVIFLLENLKVFQFNFENIWPELVTLIGIGFALGYLANRKFTSLIMPAVVLIIYGLLFTYSHISGWEHMAKLWPVLLLAPGMGFLLLYFLAGKNSTALWSASILILLSLLFLLRFVEYLRYWPALLILGGIVIILFPGKIGKNSAE